MTPTPEVVAYVTGTLVTIMAGYATKRLVGTADRLDKVLITIATHNVKIEAIQGALRRGRIRMDDIDKHLETTDGLVSDVRSDVSRIQGKIE